MKTSIMDTSKQPQPLLGDGIVFEIGMTVWTSTHIDYNPMYANFLNIYEICEPISKDTTNCHLSLLEQTTDSVGNIIPKQWVIGYTDDVNTTLTYFYSSKESSIQHAIFDRFSKHQLLQMYNHDYLINEVRRFIPSCTLEDLK